MSATAFINPAMLKALRFLLTESEIYSPALARDLRDIARLYPQFVNITEAACAEGDYMKPFFTATLTTAGRTAIL